MNNEVGFRYGTTGLVLGEPGGGKTAKPSLKEGNQHGHGLQPEVRPTVRCQNS